MTYTRNKTELARLLNNLPRKTLYNYMKMPGWPKEVPGKGWCVEECNNFILNSTTHDGLGARLDDDISKLKRWDIYERARKLKLHNDAKAGTLMPRSTFRLEISEMSSEVQKVMYSLPPRAPELAGLSVPEIEAKLTTWVDEVVRCLGTQPTKE